MHLWTLQAPVPHQTLGHRFLNDSPSTRSMYAGCGSFWARRPGCRLPPASYRPSVGGRATGGLERCRTEGRVQTTAATATAWALAATGGNNRCPCKFLPTSPTCCRTAGLLPACCQPTADLLPPRCHPVAGLRDCCQPVADRLPTSCQAVADQSPATNTFANPIANKAANCLPTTAPQRPTVAPGGDTLWPKGLLP